MTDSPPPVVVYMEDVIGTLKTYIDRGNVDACKVAVEEFLAEAATEGYEVPWDYMFQKVYIHACLRKQKEIVGWLTTLFETLDPISQIAVRHVFAYGNRLMR
jgi:hypothetical protein